MYTIIQKFMALIRSELCDAPLPADIRAEITKEDFPLFYRISKDHDIGHMMSIALQKNHLLSSEDSELIVLFGKEQNLAFYRYAKLQDTFDSVVTALENAKIPFMPLKGTVIRNLYPYPSMRTSYDIDILIHEYDSARAESALSKLTGYTVSAQRKSDGSIILISDSGARVELHISLGDNDGKYAGVLNEVWKTAYLKNDYNYRYMMSDELFYVYMIIHMMKHFIQGGCGIRSFMDIYIYRSKVSYSKEKTDEMLESIGLLESVRASERLSDVWFCQAEHTTITQAMEVYIVDGGIYGTRENRFALAIIGQGTLSYILSRLFVSFGELKEMYPVLGKAPVLYPFVQVYRWFDRLFTRGTGAFSDELRYNKRLTGKRKKLISELSNELGLR